MISRLLEVVISVHSGRPDLTVACAACVGRPPAPSAFRPRSPSRRCAERSAVVDTGNTVRARLLTRVHTTYVAPEPTSTHAHSLTRRSLSSRHSVTQRGPPTFPYGLTGMHGWMHTRHTATQRGGDRSPALSSPTLSAFIRANWQPLFLLPFFSNFQVSSKSCVTLFFRRLRASPRRHDEPTSASGAIEALALEWMRHLIDVVTPALLRLPSAWRSNLGNFLHRVDQQARCV